MKVMAMLIQKLIQISRRLSCRFASTDARESARSAGGCARFFFLCRAVMGKIA
jgi:hypothetical protein